eukprot:349674-Chlamydomonas_euryale.AAC.2
MLKLMQAMDKARYSPRVYVVAATDKMSGRKAEDFEARLQDAAAATTSDAAGAAAAASFETPSRARIDHWIASWSPVANPLLNLSTWSVEASTPSHTLHPLLHCTLSYTAPHILPGLQCCWLRCIGDAPHGVRFRWC